MSNDHPSPSHNGRAGGGVVLTWVLVLVADAGGVRQSVEDRGRAVASSGGLHYCPAELRTGVPAPLCPV